ncbi:hypothetical protein ACFVW5_17910 [Streptomyces sp. NPDC058232]|uniref:hypothetical protein n=1 Tax=Streptomyces sp. NPDC058232 TaxID=3346393 RepID=UPI0036E63CB7
MRPTIRVKPAREQMRDFAGWAVEQRPKVRTVAPDAFGVPADLFTSVPEPLLIGSLIDGQRYVSPAEDAAEGRPAPGSGDLLGVATPEGLTAQESVPGEPLPEVPTEAYGPDSVPLTAGEGGFHCDVCPREFTSERGRDTHRRLKHGEAPDAG